MAKYEESNRKIAIEFLDRADGVLFREPIERLRTWEPDYETMYRDIIIFATEVFCAQENRINKLENNLLQMQGEIRDLQKNVGSINNNLIFRVFRKLKSLFKRKGRDRKARV